MNSEKQKIEAFLRLLKIMDDLRLKCPWDREQTFETLRNLTIEETYELCDAIVKNDLNEIKNELGDIFLHIVFYSKLGSEINAFDIADVLNGISDKLIYRHPHVYKNLSVKNSDNVKKNWELLKLKEKGVGKNSVLDGVPKSLPSLVKALRIQEKTSGIGFDWNNIDDVWSKVEEEIEELRKEVNTGSKETIEDEFGNVLFSLINYARFINVNPEIALEKTNIKFIKRFQFIEKIVKSEKKSIEDLSINQMEEFWELSKIKHS
jgi:XTP/dITP diphosphohydrolase